jgi:hypothetical protein
VPDPSRPIRHRWLRFGVFEACVVLGVVATGAFLATTRARVEARVEREEAARKYADRVAEAQAEVLARRSVDADRDGVAEYATADELRRLGLLPGEPPDGYRLDVLFPLPTEGNGRRESGQPPGRRESAQPPGRRESAQPPGRRDLAPPPVDPAVAAQGFVVVVRPVSREDGLRSFYRDSLGARYATEGVMDPEAFPSPPLPATTLAPGVDQSNPGPVWRDEAPRPPPGAPAPRR